MKIPLLPYHLAYCTNVHPGEAWTEVFHNLQTYAVALKRRLCPNRPFGIGLRLSDLASRELLQGDALASFQAWLEQQDLYVFAINGFPYGGFHHQVVKDQVYAPDWTNPSRLHYTLRLIKILAVLLPADIDGGISTLPLSYKPWKPRDVESVFARSTHQIVQTVAQMVRIAAETGKVLHLDLEPEPDGLLENSAEVVAFFQEWLLPVGGAWLSQQQAVQKAQAEDWILEHVRVCYDTCHFAVEYEDPESAIAQFQAVGIKVGRLQLSSALKVVLPPDSNQRQALHSQLRPFAESTYLHQVIEQFADGTRCQHRDLVTALPELAQTAAQEWRTHFHVPIFLREYQALQSTQDHILAVLHHLPNLPEHPHLEIETYTWEVLPPALKLDLTASIEREYQWALAQLEASFALNHTWRKQERFASKS
ncbi:MAG: metabolite traffic protein EboE [Phormidesmis sp.]